MANAKGCGYPPLLPVSGASFNRSRSIITSVLRFVAIVIAVVILVYSVNLVMEFSLFPPPPTIHITSLSFSNFTVSDTKLAAIWLANFTVFNPSFALEVSLDQIETLVLYREDDPLAITSVNGFRLGFRERKNVQIVLATTGWEGDQPIVEYPVLRKIKEDRVHGTLPFSMRMSMWATFKTDLFWWTKRVLINPYCFGLDVGLANGTENGTLTGSGPKGCLVMMGAG